MQDSIFRKVSLDRLSSPEQLDQRVTVINPIGWLSLIALFVLLVSALVWGWGGKISNKVSGVGLLMYGDGMDNMVVQSSGRITDVSVKEGDSVAKGQVVARVSQDDIVRQIEECKDSLSALDIITESDVLSGASKLDYQVYLELAQISEQIQNLRSEQPDSVQIESLTKRFLRIKQVQQDEIKARLEYLNQQFSKDNRILAESSGKIMELYINKNDFVQPGMVFGTLIRETITSSNTSVMLYVPLEYGKMVKPGMEVNVSPSTVNREEYGYIIGRVKSVSDFAVSKESMEEKLWNQQLVYEFGGDNAVMQIEIELLRSINTESGYLWSTPRGAPFSIEPGTICAGEIHVSTERPVDLVMPYLKQLFP